MSPPTLVCMRNRRELAEDQHAVTAVHGLLQQLAKHRQLAGALIVEFGIVQLEQPQVAADLAQAQQCVEHDHLALCHALRRQRRP